MFVQKLKKCSCKRKNVFKTKNVRGNAKIGEHTVWIVLVTYARLIKAYKTPLWNYCISCVNILKFNTIQEKGIINVWMKSYKIRQGRKLWIGKCWCNGFVKMLTLLFRLSEIVYNVSYKHRSAKCNDWLTSFEQISIWSRRNGEHQRKKTSLAQKIWWS